ncbi:MULTISPECIES: ExbD/TolR family protein [Dyadobacter]|jgi:biopolymer transport protein ExbD|uniref:Biopolymer transport protein ExbD n=2 Tax=Dyadobacter TaxID=120831 RepID=A0A2P8G5G2_9BACT|nr:MULTISPECIES: biopolymer transporter ExbD [Dyadobacter]MBO9614257.1 biopolymer transporter ExbD [Dyadobacter sp.]MBZ1362982.1 biopolymer transporter ExbD [Dyadobacter fermentans]MDR6807557.1 biopolymer transport protein ExbD [Dyadobacter fermentans]MDR7045298.1 biopolymer transport protein ExbD [Dyadobacter sp. BE242]MDR7199611.1 biopolymer transport protein ExbD [Dyadobacter sp. BE34]
MKIRRKSRFAPEVFTHSLNDIMFFLLLFFLIISTMSNPNVIKLMLPKASATQQMYKKQITLSVDEHKAYFIDKEPVPFDNLETQLQSIFAGVEERTVVLRVDKNLAVQDLVDVLEIGAKNDIKMVMATAK